MNAVALSPDALRLRAIRAALEAIAPGVWTRAHDEKGAMIEARGGMPGEVFVLARFEAIATDDEIDFAHNAPDTVRFLLQLLEKAFATIRTLKGEPSPRNEAAGEPAAKVKDFATECAMKCQEPRFKVFLEEKHGLERPLTDDRVAQKVRGILGVTSRKELNDGGKAS